MFLLKQNHPTKASRRRPGSIVPFAKNYENLHQLTFWIPACAGMQGVEGTHIFLSNKLSNSRFRKTRDLASHLKSQNELIARTNIHKKLVNLANINDLSHTVIPAKAGIHCSACARLRMIQPVPSMDPRLRGDDERDLSPIPLGFSPHMALNRTMIIQNQTQLNDLCAALAKGPYLTIDTEFLRDKTYFPKLCLLQMAGPDVDAAAVDPLIEGLDWTPIKELMANTNVLKVFHAARQDLEIFYQLYKVLPTPIYDTQVAAMVCGFGDQVAYNALVRELTGKELEKNAQFTDWSRRPLSPQQIRYALDDVVYLRDVYEKLHAQLVKKGREEWVFEEMAILNAPRTYQNPPEESWKRIKIRSDRSDVLAVLKSLAGWREEEAVKRDVPRSRILKDETLSDIALYKPRDEDSLLQIRSLPSDLARGKVGKQVLDIVNATLDSPRDGWPKVERKDPFPKNAQGTLEMLKMLLRINCAETDVAAKLVADTDDLERLAVEENPDIPALSGWRFEMFGRDAVALKQGKIALRLEKGRVKKSTF